MSDTISGHTTYKGKEFTFFLVDYILTLVQKDSNIPGLGIYQQDRLPYLEGVTTDGHKICFYNLSLSGAMIYQKLVTSISAYIVGRNNRQSLKFSSFSAISFCGEIVDKYFNPSAKLDQEKSSNDIENGSSIRVLKPFIDVDIRYNIKPGLDLTLGVVDPQMPDTNIHNLGVLHSMLRLQSESCWSLNDVINLYLSIFRLFSFFNFRSNISFEQVTLSSFSDGKYYPVGDLHMANKYPCTNIKMNKTITYLDVNEKIVNLYIHLSNNKKLTCFIPENDEAAHYVDYDSYILTSAIFEKVFSLSYPKAILKNTNPVRLEVRNRILADIQEIVSTSIGDYQVEANNYLNAFEHIGERTLRDRFTYCLMQNRTIIEKVFPSVKLTDNEISKLSSDFVKQRNAFSHGNFERINVFSVPPYSYTIILIYIMILKQLEIDDQSITRIIKNMFRMYPYQESN